MDDLLTYIEDYWRAVVEVLILWFIIYQTYRYFRATRGARIFIALISIFIGMTLIAMALDLIVITRVLAYVSIFLPIALVVIFVPELRRALAELGSHKLFSSFSEQARTEFTEKLVEIAESLSHRRVGALIAIQRSIDLKQYLETGVEMDSRLSTELVSTIFYSGTTLHDGGMIVRLGDERILGAGCVFPLTQREMSDRSIGLRHRASMGITEESDAIALVVSEETGRISIATEGKLEADLSEDQLRDRLKELFFVEDDSEEDENENEDESTDDSESKAKNREEKDDEESDSQ